MSRPDVALVTPYPTTGQRHAGPTGVASYAANLAHALAGAGASVRVIAPREPDAPAEPTTTSDGPVEVTRPFARGAAALPAAARAAVASGAPVVHLQHEMFLYGGPAAVPGIVPALAALRRRTRPVVTLHHVVDPATIDRGFTELHRVRVPAPAARWALGGVQRAVASLSSACIVHEASFAPVVRGAQVIPHGVERCAPAERIEARRHLGLDDRLVVLCFGFVAPYKGIETVLEAGRIAGADRVQVVVAGGPHPRLAAAGDDYAGRLEAELGGPGARFTGWVPESDVPRWFAAADVAAFTYPAPFSSSGALALAMAHGTPVLLSSPMAECIGAPSALIAPATPWELAERLTALTDRDELARVRAASAPLVAGREWPAVAAAHLDLYERVVAA